jgi:hypothetical protein
MATGIKDQRSKLHQRALILVAARVLPVDRTPMEKQIFPAFSCGRAWISDLLRRAYSFISCAFVGTLREKETRG